MQNSRERMISIIKGKYGLDSPEVFAAMLQVPRYKFVDKKYRSIAYSDGPVPIGFNQTMSQPYTVAFMTYLLKLTGKEKVLEIGTGSGYQAAVLAKLAREVYTVEIIPELFKRAEKTLKKLGFENIFVKMGSGEWGWAENAPFDRIVVTAALEGNVPDGLIQQLGIGGMLVAPIGPQDLQTMTRIIKGKDGALKQEEFQKFVFVPFVRENN
jgi:protein-L-isoaspartate(D-aspartate) O-methyltransferase